MKLEYRIKHNGVYYERGEEDPRESNGGVKSPAVDDSGKVETEKVMEDEMLKRSDAVWADFDKKVASRKYSEDDLNLPYMKLKALAKKEGFKINNTAKADEIKALLRNV